MQPAGDLDDVTEAILRASRALVGVAARSLASVDGDVTLPQYRALVLLREGPRPVHALADALDVHASTATRMCDRLVAKRLVLRAADGDDRRRVLVRLSARGTRLVDGVTQRRRTEIRAIAGALDRPTRLAVVAALTSFADAAGEPLDATTLGWSPA